MSTISAVSSSGNAWAALNTQRSQHQARMFAKVDTDGSGGVDQTELSTMLSDVSTKTRTNLGDSKELFTKMDSNADGSLSSDELGQGMKALMPPPSTMDFAQSRGAGGEDDLFSKVDSNSDGLLDATEVKALADKIKSDTGEDVSDKFSQLDTDGDAKLTKAEFDAGKPQASDASSSTQASAARSGPSGPPPAGGPGGAGRAGGASSSTTYDPLDINQDGTVSEMERLAGALKELAQTTQTDSSGNSSSSEVAKLAQKLYEQISADLTSSGKTNTSTSQLSATA
ncbi:calcium-binding protein [Rhodoferax lacus]|uniref:Calcium-binding protein n=1 Tax=Rhodoferax lacus TaxID=2184758 RepID=A0A3E1RK19_9BURK|nr:XopAW family type III secretion system calcium-binding effector [Rhodoferax lacus]RFO98910.1 calcium-binding protein [Rhodoferax lacus]